ncbi:MAG: ABC transporter substrate-binding protein [Egibacteraceae bacterium]
MANNLTSRKKAPRRAAAALILSLALLASACGAQGSGGSVPGAGDAPPGGDGGGEVAGGDSADAIKVGLLQPLTGPVSAAGIAVRDGAKIALEEVNADGGINGRPLQLVIEDDENDPAVCTSAANKVITRDDVVGIIGGWGSSCTLAISPVTAREQVPLVVETSSSFKITDPQEQGNDWTFRLNPPTRMEVAAVEDDLVEGLGFEKVFFMGVNNDWGRGSVDDFTPAVEDNGGEVVGAEFFEQTEENFSPILTNVQNSEAESVIVTTDAAQIALILQQMEQLGIDQKVLTTGGSNFPGKVQQLAGDSAVEGVYFTVFFPGAYDPSMAVAEDRAASFVKEWNANHDPNEIGESARGYDAVYTVAEALRSIDGEITRESFREALETVSLEGIMYGDIEFEDWEGLINQNVSDVFIGQIRNGELGFVQQ